MQQAFMKKELAMPSDQVPSPKMHDAYKIVNNLTELQAKIAEAKKDGKKLRVVGANHSVPESIGDESQEIEKTLLIVLSGDFRKITLVDGEGNYLFICS